MEISIFVDFNEIVITELQELLFSLGYIWNGGETTPISIVGGVYPERYMVIDAKFNRKRLSYNTTKLTLDQCYEDFDNKDYVAVKYSNKHKLIQLLIYGDRLPLYKPRTIIKTI